MARQLVEGGMVTSEPEEEADQQKVEELEVL